jgi:hypothetical protein
MRLHALTFPRGQSHRHGDGGLASETIWLCLPRQRLMESGLTYENEANQKNHGKGWAPDRRAAPDRRGALHPPDEPGDVLSRWMHLRFCQHLCREVRRCLDIVV